MTNLPSRQPEIGTVARKSEVPPGRPKLRCVLFGHRWTEFGRREERFMFWMRRCRVCGDEWNTGDGNRAWD